MKRLILLVGLVLLAGAALGTASARTDAKKTAICHRTTSSKTPYVKIKVAAKALRAHGKHAADIVPAPTGGCPKSVLSPTSGGNVFQVALTGEAEGTTGDPVATGTATVRLRAGQAQVCYQVAADHLPASAGAHIHEGAAGTSGNVVVPLKTPGSDGKVSGCTNTSRPIVNDILANAAGFYVNVHTAESPDGAIRGQLTGTSTASFGWVTAITLKGSTEPDATGTAVVRIRRDMNLVCYRLHAEKITLPSTNAHIHRGGANASGPVVVPLTPPDATGNSSGCTQSTQAIVDEIIANPANFYVNVHTKEHPGGAMRAQLG